MTKIEFEKLATRPFTEDDYSKIETVYAFYPAISETQGKRQIAYLFNTFGMRIIRDMLPTANAAQELEKEIQKHRAAINELQDKLQALKL